MRLLPILACAAVLAGCGSDPPPKPRPAAPRAAPEPRVRAAHCSRQAGNCKAATGRILYIEAVDPDGDGDAHFVLAGRNGITLPGVSVIDVEKAMRPHPLPRPGDLVSAAGPVYPGSYNQRQIQATELHVARLR
jgi:hypothetical protein